MATYISIDRKLYKSSPRGFVLVSEWKNTLTDHDQAVGVYERALRARIEKSKTMPKGAL